MIQIAFMPVCTAQMQRLPCLIVPLTDWLCNLLKLNISWRSQASVPGFCLSLGPFPHSAWLFLSLWGHGFLPLKADEKEGRGEKEKEEMEERYKAEEEEWERSRKWQKIRKKIILRPKEVLITCLDISRIWLYNWVNYSTPPGSSLRSLICKTTVISNYQYCFDTEN